jgi:hypothetical protein
MKNADHHNASNVKEFLAGLADATLGDLVDYAQSFDEETVNGLVFARSGIVVAIWGGNSHRILKGVDLTVEQGDEPSVKLADIPYEAIKNGTPISVLRCNDEDEALTLERRYAHEPEGVK